MGKQRTIASIRQVIQTYNGHGFNVKTILGDGQLEQIRKAIDGTGINLNTTRRDEHVWQLNVSLGQSKRECGLQQMICLLRHGHTGLSSKWSTT